MKIRIIFITFIFTILSTILSAQVDNQTKPILVKGISHEGVIKLRWLLSDDNDLLLALDKGFEINRYTYAVGGVDLDAKTVANSKIVIANNYKPYDSNQWENLNSDLASTVKEILYNNILDYVPSGKENLADAVNVEKAKSGKSFALQILAEQNVEVAKGLALYIEDINVDYSHEYMYSVKVLDTDIEAGITKVLHEASGNTIKPTISSAIGSDKTITLNWTSEGMEEYTLYNIERSLDNINFAKVNDAPFMMFYTSDLEDDGLHYQDSIPQNNVPYYYRIIGLSSFGYASDPSLSIMAMGRPPRKDVHLGLDTFYFQGEGLVFNWKFPTDLESEFINFDLYSMNKIGDVLQKVNQSPIATTERSFTVVEPQPSAYYILEGKDINDYTYRSRATLAQVADSIPPAMPLGLTGEIRRDGKVKITWESNTEDDLQGYEILYANEVDGEYVQLTSSLLLTERYVGQIDPSVEADYLYYIVRAADNRYNLSEPSAVLVLKRPDITPPSKPLLAQVLPRPDEIRIGWRLSGSKDVVMYELQRKPQTASKWVTIMSFEPQDVPDDLPMVPGENIASQYLDKDALEMKNYNYRLIAKDDDGNVSSSLVKTVKPYDDGLRGKVKLQSVDSVDYQSPYGGSWTNINTNGGGSGAVGNPAGNIFTTYPNASTTEKRIFLHWTNVTKFSSSIKEYKIYRKTAAPAVNITSAATFTNKYTIVATISHEAATSLGDQYKGGGLGWLDELTIKNPKDQNTYIYKVIAWHKDGGFSEVSNQKSISF